MPQDNLTEIVCIIDRSGSMQSIREDAQGGFDSFIEEQQKEEGKATVTLAQFDNEYEMVWSNRPLETIKKGEYLLMPRGQTALLDAVGKTVGLVGERLSKTDEAERPGKVLVMIITDGMENHSKEYNRKQIMEMINHQRDKYNWDFLFLAANQDAIGEARGIGIKGAHAMNFAATGQGVKSAYAGMSRGVSKYRRTGHTELPDHAEDDDKKPEGKKKAGFRPRSS
jgi:uncharacterized protein YegL